jgi:hypothetical protein
MKNLRLAHLLLALAAVFALSFGIASAQPGWTYQGCWSPYPNCAGGAHVYTDAAGNFYQCNACTSGPPSTANCRRSGNLNQIGYWCS